MALMKLRGRGVRVEVQIFSKRPKESDVTLLQDHPFGNLDGIPVHLYSPLKSQEEVVLSAIIRSADFDPNYIQLARVYLA